MFGRGFKHISKDKFLIIEDGYDVKVIVKLLKKDMQKALREEGLDDSGKKDVILERFIRLTENLSQPKSEPKAKAKPEAKPKPTPAPKAETNLYQSSEDIPPNPALKLKKPTVAEIREGFKKFQKEKAEGTLEVKPNLFKLTKSERKKIYEEDLKSQLPKPEETKKILERFRERFVEKKKKEFAERFEQKPLTEDQFVEEFNTPWASNALFQYDQKSYEALEKFLQKQAKKDAYIQIDLLLSKNIHIPISTVKKLVLKYGLLETFAMFKDLLKSIDGDARAQPFTNEIYDDFNKSRTFTALKLNKEEKKIVNPNPLTPAERLELKKQAEAKVKPKPKPEPKAEKEAYQILYNEETSRLGKGFFRHIDKDRFMVETQGKKDIKNMKAKLLKADMQKAIKDSGLPLSSTGKKDEVIKNFIRLTNARTVPLKLKKKEI